MTFKFSPKFLFAIVSLCMLQFACTSKKKVIYFQADAELPTTSNFYSPVFKKGDLLSIMVMGMNAEAVVPFNLPNNTYVTGNMGGYYQGAPTPPGYSIDIEGNIDFPVIGKLHIEGLSRLQTIDLLKQKLSEYISKPSVNIRILNYKVTVLGEVKNPGTFTIPNERITLPEALGIAGDLLITGKRKDVLVIRETDGKKSEFRVDLTSKELFASPVYYLQQNDIVYVTPNRSRINSSVVNATNVSIGISVLSLLITLSTVLTR